MNILILGANGQIARVATDLFLADTDVQLTLYLRRAARLQARAQTPRVRLVEGDVLDQAALAAAMAGQDVVYANLNGDLANQARTIVETMQAAGPRRLIFVSSMGIYDEVPGQSHGAVLDPYRDAARIIEASDLDYTIVRPAWLNDRDEVAYGTTRKGQPFANADQSVSRKSVADLIVKLATSPGLHVHASLGVHKR
jgi:uncharacterized protein YbjT (DUF2867 family)